VSEAKSWREIRRQIPVNEQQSALYRRMVEAELRLGTLDLAAVRRRRGVRQSTIANGLDVSQPNVSRIESEEDLYLSTLARYVAALGGRLEINAVFDDETISLLGEPPAPRPND